MKYLTPFVLLSCLQLVACSSSQPESSAGAAGGVALVALSTPASLVASAFEADPANPGYCVVKGKESYVPKTGETRKTQPCTLSIKETDFNKSKKVTLTFASGYTSTELASALPSPTGTYTLWRASLSTDENTPQTTSLGQFTTAQFAQNGFSEVLPKANAKISYYLTTKSQKLSCNEYSECKGLLLASFQLTKVEQ